VLLLPYTNGPFIAGRTGWCSKAISLASIVDAFWRGLVVEDTNNSQPLGEEGDFAVHASVYGKVQTEDNVYPNNQETRGKRRMLLLARAGLSSYLCRLCTICVSQSRLGVGIYFTTV
jgi:hypothetical protein